MKSKIPGFYIFIFNEGFHFIQQLHLLVLQCVKCCAGCADISVLKKGLK